ncbi:MAG: hypothetical protein U9P80_05585 [Thermodesulfobacteriota bacterium]|nr:hypothetical protein [Thermodesulfobacteriota bacterium]
MFIYVFGYGIKNTMIWILLFLPLCLWLSITVLADLNGLTLAIMALTVAIFFFVESRQISGDPSRSRMPLWIMGLMLLGIGATLLPFAPFA